MTNFRQYRHLDLDFVEGITGIVGKNGSGKSTILEAVLWCLFGARAARTGKEGVKRQLAGPAEDCIVALDFALGKAEYTATRSLRGRSNRAEAQVLQAGAVDAITTREVDQYIVRLIGLDLKSFLSSYFARQKELNALTDSRPAERKDHLARMLGVGRLDAAIKLVKDDIRAVRQGIDALESIRLDPDRTREQIAGLEKQLKEHRARKAGIEKELAEREAEKAEIDKRLAMLREKQEQFNLIERGESETRGRQESIRAEVSNLKEEIKTLEKERENLTGLQKALGPLTETREKVRQIEKLKAADQERARLVREAEAVVKSEKNTNERTAALSTKLDKWKDLPEKHRNAKEQEKRLRAEVETLRERFAEIKQELALLKQQQKTLEDQRAEIETLGPEAVCSLCLRPFAGDLETIRAHFDRELTTLVEKAEPLEKRLETVRDDGGKSRKKHDDVQRALEAEERELREFGDLQSRLAAENGRLADLVRRRQEIESRLAEIGEVAFDPEEAQKLETRLAELLQTEKEAIKLEERVKRIPGLEKSLAEKEKASVQLAEKLEELAGRKAELEFDPAGYAAEEKRREASAEQVSRCRVEREKSEGAIKVAETERKVLLEQLNQFVEARKRLSDERERLTYLEKLSILFGEFRTFLISQIRPALSRQSGRLFYEMTDGRYNEIELDESYNLAVFDRGERFPIDRFSGGEKDLANLCLRLAISLELTATSGIDSTFIILDEIFGSQDIDRQRLIIEGLSRLKNRFQQIIMISHIEDVKELSENLIQVTMDNNGDSRAEYVVRS